MGKKRFLWAVYLLILIVLTALWVISAILEKWIELLAWGLIFAIVFGVLFVIIRPRGKKKEVVAKRKRPPRKKSPKKKPKRKWFVWAKKIFRRGKKAKKPEKKKRRAKKKKKPRKKRFVWLRKLFKRKKAPKKKPQKIKALKRKEKKVKKRSWFSWPKKKKLKVYKAKEEKAEEAPEAPEGKVLKVYKAAPEKTVKKKVPPLPKPIAEKFRLIEINKPKIGARTSKREVKTDFDKVYEFVQKKGETPFSEVAEKFKTTKEKVAEWASLLEEHGLVEVYYPTFGEPRLRRRKNDRKV